MLKSAFHCVPIQISCDCNRNDRRSLVVLLITETRVPFPPADLPPIAARTLVFDRGCGVRISHSPFISALCALFRSVVIAQIVAIDGTHSKEHRHRLISTPNLKLIKCRPHITALGAGGDCIICQHMSLSFDRYSTYRLSLDESPSPGLVYHPVLLAGSTSFHSRSYRSEIDKDMFGMIERSVPEESRALLRFVSSSGNCSSMGRL